MARSVRASSASASPACISRSPDSSAESVDQALLQRLEQAQALAEFAPRPREGLVDLARIAFERWISLGSPLR